MSTPHDESPDSFEMKFGLTTWDNASQMLADSEILQHRSSDDWDKYEIEHPELGNVRVLMTVEGFALLGAFNEEALEITSAGHRLFAA